MTSLWRLWAGGVAKDANCSRHCRVRYLEGFRRGPHSAFSGPATPRSVLPKACAFAQVIQPVRKSPLKTSGWLAFVETWHGWLMHRTIRTDDDRYRIATSANCPSSRGNRVPVDFPAGGCERGRCAEFRRWTGHFFQRFLNGAHDPLRMLALLGAADHAALERWSGTRPEGSHHKLCGEIFPAKTVRRPIGEVDFALAMAISI